MKKSHIAVIIIIAIIGLIALWGIGTYNSLISSKESVENEYANIEVQLERRADLIPNLVNTVKGYTQHEQKTIDKITTARENLIKANNIEDKAKASEELDQAIDALMVIVENYPDLKASSNFINLQDELAGTENRIATARRDYNNAVKSYNQEIKRIPNNVIASIAGLKKEKYFEVSESKKEVPNVSFE